MANLEQLEILKQGVEVWNSWKVENPKTEIDLSNVNFTLADLEGADFSKVNFHLATFSLASLWDSNFSEANLRGAQLNGAHLSGCNLTKASLIAADLRGADFIGSNFLKAIIGYTKFGDSDLSMVTGLETVAHAAPSSLATDTFVLSKGKIPPAFLRGCGLTDWEIEFVKLYNPELRKDEFVDIQNKIFDLRNRQIFQISSVFISYSHADSQFVDKIEVYLNKKGVRFWRDIHDAKAGRLEKQVERAMRLNPTVLLVLSEQSLKSDWVEHEVRTARSLEKEMGRDVLCPLALDDKWKNSPWSKRIMEQVIEYNILDFSAWRDDAKFESIFNKLIDGLELFYK